MEKKLTVTIEPRPKERPQGRVAYTKEKKPYVQMYTPPETKKYEDAIRKAWVKEHGETPMEGPLVIRLYFYFRIPKSDTKTKKAQKIDGKLREEIREDVDNCAKSILDALNKTAYGDDRQVVTVLAKKRYAEVPHVTIILAEYKPKEESA